MQNGPGKTELSTKLYYGFGAVAFGVKQNGFAFFLLMYYNQVLGLPEKSVGLAIMVALLFDAISDPIVGSLSDRFHSRWGRRHPFMYLSVLPIGISYFFLWNPPAGLTPGRLWVHLVVLAILVRLFITFFEIPNTSLISELATGRRSEGVFFAGLSLVGKAVAGIGVMLSTVILSVVGFPQDAQPGSVDLEIMTNLAVVFVPTLTVLYLTAAFLVTAFRISKASHEENLRQLAGSRAGGISLQS